MRKIIKISLITTLITSHVLANSSITPASASKIDVKTECDVKTKGIKKVLDTAKQYNEVAKKYGLEFMRLGMKNSQYINAVEEGLKNKSKTIDIVNKKKKKTGEVSISFGAYRACSFALRALQQSHEAESSWRLSVPGDGYKY